MDWSAMRGLERDQKSRAQPWAGALVGVCAALLLAGGALAGAASGPAPWLLTSKQRRAFLYAYAPIIFKAADEGKKRIGHEWMTNYDFDRDGFFLPNNGENWLRELSAYVREGRHPHWRIRPTLYSALLEFMYEGEKSAVLIYHIYHAMDGTHTHDWERIEIRLDGLSEAPVSGERVRYAAVTEHHLSAGRRAPDQNLQFFETDSGRHLMVWQAPQTKRWLRPSKGELHFVRTPVESLPGRDASSERAELRIARGKERLFHYVFVPDADAQLVEHWGAQALGRCNAQQLVSGAKRNPVPMNEVRSITYELQDLSDFFSEQWRNEGEGRWSDPLVTILLRSPLLDEAGIEQVPAGLQRFANGFPDSLFGGDQVRGLIGKNAFWGTYLFDRLFLWKRGGILPDLSGAYRARKLYCARKQLGNCHQEGFWQHDFFAHTGERAWGPARNEIGEWLEGGWYEAENGGFDGRWAQLFPDRPGDDGACTPSGVSN
jgi:hypothetical protein